MISLRCTKKLLKYYGFKPNVEEFEPTSVLGDWYANIIDSAIGALIIFVNEKSRLAVIFQGNMLSDHLVDEFRNRALRLLKRLDLPDHSVEREAFHMSDIKIGLTKSRAIIGSMNEVGHYMQAIADDIAAGEQITLDEIEMKLAKFIHMPLKEHYPMEAARNLLVPKSDNS